MVDNDHRTPIHTLGKVVLLTGSSFILLAGMGLTTAMPAMKREFIAIPGVDFWVSMIVTLPALFVVIGGPIIGYLTDRFGRKPILAISLVLGALSGSSAFFLNSLAAILVSRALVGLSTAGAMTATNSLIADYFDGQERVNFMGLRSALMGLISVFLILLGGYLSDIQWHLTFLPYLAAILLFPLTLVYIREPIGTNKNNEGGLRVKLTLSPSIIYIFASIFLCHFVILSVPVFSAFYLGDLVSADSMTVGLAGAVFGTLAFMGGIFYERISRRVAYRGIALVVCILAGAGFLVFAFAGHWPMIIIGEVIIGYSMGLINSNLPTWLAAEVDQNVRGRANGIFVTMMFLGQFSTPLVFTPIINAKGYRYSFISGAVLLVLIGLAALFIKPTKGSKAIISECTEE